MSTHTLRKVIASVIDVSSGEDLYCVKIEPSAVTYQVFSQSGNITGGQALWQTAPLNNYSNTLVNRLFRIRYTVTVTTANANTKFNSGQALVGAAIAPVLALRDLPFQSLCGTGALEINSTAVTMTIQNVIGCIKRRFPKEFIRKYGSECPLMQDQSAVLFNEASQAVTVGGAGLTAVTGLSTSDQPFSGYYNCVDGASRASFLPYAVNGTASVSFNVVEPVVISPCVMFSENETPFAQLNSLTLRYQYSNNLLGMVSVANGGTYPADLAVALGTTAFLETLQYNVDTSLVSIPKQISLGYEQIQYNPTGNITGFTDASFSSAVQVASINSNVFQLAGTPSVIMIRLAPDPNWLGTTQPAQGGVSIADCGLQWGDNTGKDSGQFTLNYNGVPVVSTLSTQMLWRMSVKNGLNQSYIQWKMSGGPIYITPSDFGLDLSSGATPQGLTNKTNVFITATFNNTNWVTASAELGAVNTFNGLGIANNLVLQMAVVYSGACYIDPSQASFPIGYLSANEIQAALSSASPYIPEKMVQGGSLWSTGKHIINGTAKALLSASSDDDVQRLLKRAERMTRK